MMRVPFTILGLILLQASSESLQKADRSAIDALEAARYPEALVKFEEALNDPELAATPARRAQLHYGRGMAYLGLIRYRAAAAAFDEAVALDPGQMASWSRLVVVRAQLGERDGAREAFETVRALGGPRRGESLELARALRRAGWLELARSFLESIPERSAVEAGELGVILMELGHTETARAHLARAVAESPSADAHYQLALCLERLGDTEGAIAHLREALGLDVTLAKARFRLGTLLLRTGARDEGRALLDGYEEFRRWERRVNLLLAIVGSESLPPSEDAAKRQELIRLLIEGGDLARAREIVRASRAKFPQAREFVLDEARIAWTEGRYDEAHRLLSNVTGDDALPEAVWLLGRVELIRGNLESALTAFERARELLPEPPARFHQDMATAQAMAGQHAVAVTTLEKALRKAPDDAVIRADLALVLETAGRLDAAEERYREAIALDGDSVAALIGLGGLLVRDERADEALPLLRRAVELSPHAPELRLELARALDALGQSDEAARERATAKKLGGPSPR